MRLALVNHFKGAQVLTPPEPALAEVGVEALDLKDIKGQETAKTSMPPAQAASPPWAAGQISPRSQAWAWMAAGSTPATGLIRPSSANSPKAA